MRKKMTITIKSKPNLVMPESIRRAAGFKTGDRLEVKVSGRMVTILPKIKTINPSDEFTPAELKKIRVGIKQAREGKTIPWSDIKHELGL